MMSDIEYEIMEPNKEISKLFFREENYIMSDNNFQELRDQ